MLWRNRLSALIEDFSMWNPAIFRRSIILANTPDGNEAGLEWYVQEATVLYFLI